MPILFLNFKTYKEATGKNALKLAKIAQSVTKKTGTKIVLVVQATDIKEISKNSSLEVFAQHVDPIKIGSNTGFILPLALKEAGSNGTILNHAENKRSNEFIESALVEAKSVGLKVMLCAESVYRAEQLAKFSPDFIAIEPPEPIGGDISTSTAKPGIIVNAVKKIKEINPKIKVIAGAGIKTAMDSKLALKFGCSGVFVASSVILAKNQKLALEELIKGF